MNKIVDFFIILVFPIFILCYSTIIHVSNNFLYIIYGIILGLSIIKNKKIIINKKFKKFYVFGALSFIVIPAIVLHITTLNAVMYVLLLLLFICVIDVIAQQIHSNKKILVYWAGISSVILLIHILLNYSQISISAMYKNFEIVDRTRVYFGFNNPNATAMICYCVFILLYRINKEIKNKYIKIIIYLTQVIIVVALLCTGCRTAVLGFILFFALKLVFNILKKIKGQGIRGFIIFISIITCLFVTVNIFENGDTKSLSKLSSGRLEEIIDGTQTLIDKGYFLFGYKVINQSKGYTIFDAIDIGTTDNFYYTYILTFGIVGIIVLLIPYITSIRELYHGFNNNIIENNSLCLLISILIYGIGENIVFSQGAIISLFTLVFVAEDLIKLNKDIDKSNDALVKI